MRRLVGRLTAALLLTVGLSACAIPPAVSIASMAADGVLLVATGKSKTDHGLSLATGKDCATFRVLEGQDVCQEQVVAQMEPLPAELVRELDALRAAPRQPDQVSHGAVALAAAFHAPAAAPVAAVTAMPQPAAPIAVASASPVRTRLAALHMPSGATPGRVKFDRPDTRRPALAAQAVPSAKAKLAAGKAAKRFAALKGKRLAGLKVKPVSPAPKDGMRAAGFAAPPLVLPSGGKLSQAPPAIPLLQLAFAAP